MVAATRPARLAAAPEAAPKEELNVNGLKPPRPLWSLAPSKPSDLAKKVVLGPVKRAAALPLPPSVQVVLTDLSTVTRTRRPNVIWSKPSLVVLQPTVSPTALAARAGAATSLHTVALAVVHVQYSAEAEASPEAATAAVEEQVGWRSLPPAVRLLLRERPSSIVSDQSLVVDVPHRPALQTRMSLPATAVAITGKPAHCHQIQAPASIEAVCLMEVLWPLVRVLVLLLPEMTTTAGTAT